MSFIIKSIALIWLTFCILVSWVGCALVGFIFAFSDYHFVTNVIPLIGLTIVACFIKCGVSVLKYNP